jgi:hypothetical protein
VDNRYTTVDSWELQACDEMTLATGLSTYQPTFRSIVMGHLAELFWRVSDEENTFPYTREKPMIGTREFNKALLVSHLPRDRPYHEGAEWYLNHIVTVPPALRNRKNISGQVEYIPKYHRLWQTEVTGVLEPCFHPLRRHARKTWANGRPPVSHRSPAQLI